MNQYPLEVSGLGKSFRKYRTEWHRIVSWFGMSTKPPLENWVLRDISFSVAPGEAVGIIGKNGAGKSTLLKLITGTLRPTEGSVQIKGRVAAILELGMGFVSDFTGRQNVFLSAGLLGYSRKEIEKVMPDIEGFAEIGAYFDHPLRTYSSGMQVRLAFSIATAFKPDILIIDEALSVGDAYFQCKSFDKIREFKKAGVTLLFVSHDPGAVKTLCNRAILLDEGKLIRDDMPDVVLDYYNAMITKKEKEQEILQYEILKGNVQTRSGNKHARIDRVELLNRDDTQTRAFQVGEEARIVCEICFDQEIDSPTIGFLIRDHLGNDIFGTNTFHTKPIRERGKTGETLQVVFSLPLNIGVGNYALSVAVHASDSHISDNYDWWDRAIIFQVVPGPNNFFIGAAYLPSTVQIRSGAYVKY